LVECPVEFDDLRRAKNDPYVAQAEENGENQDHINGRRQLDYLAEVYDGTKYLKHEPRYHQRNKNSAGQMKNDAHRKGAQQGDQRN